MKKITIIILLIIAAALLTVLFMQDAKIVGMAVQNKECLASGLCGG